MRRVSATKSWVMINLSGDCGRRVSCRDVTTTVLMGYAFITQGGESVLNSEHGSSMAEPIISSAPP